MAWIFSARYFFNKKSSEANGLEEASERTGSEEDLESFLEAVDRAKIKVLSVNILNSTYNIHEIK